MKNITFTLPTAADLPQLERIYFEAFPPEERRPWHDVATGGSKPALRAIKDKGETVGLISYWNFDGFLYIEHFATDPEKRNKGLGTRALRAFSEAQPTPLLIEVEPPSTNPMAARRIEFYKRHGFHTLPYSYTQPPYAPGLPSVPLLLMATAPIPNPTEILHKEVYGLGE